MEGCSPFPLDPIDISGPETYTYCTNEAIDIVNPSAAQIECWVSDYSLSHPGVADMHGVEQVSGLGVMGDPVCCETCAMTNTADESCERTCRKNLCLVARDQHIQIASDLDRNCPYNGIAPCGFDFDECMAENDHVQFIVESGWNPKPVVAYALHVNCHASALNEHGENGRFSYLELLDGISDPARPELEDIDVVAWCESPPYATDATPPMEDDGSSDTDGTGGAEGADSTGPGSASGGDSSTDGDGSGGGETVPSAPPPAISGIPQSCDLTKRTGVVRGPNNKVMWRKDSPGGLWDRTAYYPAGEITGGMA